MIYRISRIYTISMSCPTGGYKQQRFLDVALELGRNSAVCISPVAFSPLTG
jgi:hypothetical protein